MKQAYQKTKETGEDQIKQVQGKLEAKLMEVQTMKYHHDKELKRIRTEMAEESDKQIDSLHKDYAGKITLFSSQNEDTAQETKQSMLRELKEHAEQLLLDLGFSEDDTEQIQEEQLNTVESVVEFLYKLIQSKLELNSIELEDKIEELEEVKKSNDAIEEEVENVRQFSENRILELKTASQKQLAEKQKEVERLSIQSKMSDGQLHLFTQTWNSICSRFDTSQLEKFKDQASTDAEDWIQMRLMKAMDGVELDTNFISLFQHQMVTLFQLYFHLKAQHQILFDRDKKIQIEQAQNAKHSAEMKETTLQLKQSQQQLSSTSQVEKEFQDNMNRAIQEKISLKITADENNERLQILSEENKSLRTKIYDMDDEVKKYKKQMKQLQITLEGHQQI